MTTKWTKAKHRRLCELIDKDIDASLTEAETAEHAGLKAEFDAFRATIIGEQGLKWVDEMLEFFEQARNAQNGVSS